MLHPSGAPKSYFAEFGWVGGSDSPNLPGPTTIWSSDGKQLTPGQPVTLSWDNGAGLKFERTYSLDEGYMVTVTQKVINTGETPTALFPYGLIARSGTPDTLGFTFFTKDHWVFLTGRFVNMIMTMFKKQEK